MRLTRRQFTKALAALGVVAALPALPAATDPAQEAPPRTLWVLNRALIPFDDDDWEFYQDGHRDATAFLQRHIDRHARDGGIVQLPSGIFRITDTLYLPATSACVYDGGGSRIVADGVTKAALHLAGGAGNVLTSWNIDLIKAPRQAAAFSLSA
jgi:hypothetical protein